MMPDKGGGGCSPRAKATKTLDNMKTVPTSFSLGQRLLGGC